MTDIVKKHHEQQQLANPTQKLFVGRGNNDAVVRSVVKQRAWWVQHGVEDFGEVSFMWTQWKKQKHIDYLKP